MKNYFLLSILIGLFMLSGCDSNSGKNSEIGKKITTTEINNQEKTAEKTTVSLTDDYAEAARILFKNRAVSASLFGIPEEDAGYHFASSLENYSPQSEQHFRKQMSNLAKKLKTAKPATGVAEENRQVMIDLASYYAGDADLSVGFIDSWMGQSAFVLNQINGPMIDIPNNLINSHTIHNLADAKDYISRLISFQKMAQSILEKARYDEQTGWFPPKVLIDKTHSYLERFSSGVAENSELVKSFKKRLDVVDSISVDEKQQLIEQAVSAVKSSVFPGFHLLADYTQKLSDKGRAEAGIWAQPDGDKFYANAIKRLGDSRLDAEQIHQLGLSEVSRISKQMDTILSQQGYSKGSVGERMITLGEELRFLYTNDDTGRAELLASLNQMINDISVKMPEYFSSIPAYKVEVRRIPVATQDSSAGGYYTPPTFDGTVPGIYWINLKSTTANPKFTLKSLTYHEAVPGHHWQIALNLAQKELPLLRRIAPYNAYVEGWALYSEQVAAEMGMYKDDPFGDLGRLQAELFRAVRLVVDTGMHYKKWSREQAIEYMSSQTGSDKEDVVSEIERYMAWPGQALGYKLGMLKILQLRTLAQQQLAEKFDLKKFHDVVLLGGAVPMRVLQKKIEQWIASEKHIANNL